jgi:AraC-like DNA-binding protein
MKPLIQKLPLNSDTSFVARTYRTPNFEVPWHQHIEYELILFTEGRGMCFIGNYVGEFAEGDVFFLGSNLPHTFQKQVKDQVASAVVVQFTDDFWGTDFLRIPESLALKNLFALSMNGIKIEGSSKARLGSLIRELENAEGFSRISTLCSCMELIIREEVKTILSTRQMSFLNKKYQQRLDKIFHYTITHFQEPIALAQIAAIANMSETAFCSYFKKSSKKSYVEFLNEIRVGYACKLLQDTDKPIIDICFESGFNTPVNFNKQFFKIKKTTPSQFRNQFNKGVAEADKSLRYI